MSIEVPAWARATEGENRWAAAAAIVVAVTLQAVLSDDLTPGKWYLLPCLGIALLAILVAVNPMRMTKESRAIRILALGLIVLINGANGYSLVEFVLKIASTKDINGTMLLSNAAIIWVTNVIVFALWFWELDRGGPVARSQGRIPSPDFLFPQMTEPRLSEQDWEPTFVDYLYLSFTNSTAFSPTDTMPLSRWAKMLMMVQSLASLVTLALVAARAVNVLGG
ncbi:DUF1345 domain-containing protein [Pseudonocardiaceae bacterium YIM PH 21723]|nr:DUF1345 domain-containing protein [Pseudonocardiaceae bacterium YIM PH 21723]